MGANPDDGLAARGIGAERTVTTHGLPVDGRTPVDRRWSVDALAVHNLAEPA